MPASRLRGRRFETVVLGGLSGGEFPARQAETMLPGSAVAEMLRAFGGRGEAGRGIAYEELLFYESVTRARKRLVMSACTADSDGTALALSPFLEQVAESFLGDGDEREFPVNAYRRIGEAPSSEALLKRERMQAEAMQGARSSPRVQAAIRRASARPGRFADPNTAAVLPVDGPFSASQIESYLRCPYRWFHEHAVAPRELERSFDARDEGSIAHALLAAYYKKRIDRAEGPLPIGMLPDALAELDTLFFSECEARGPAGSLAERTGRRKALAWVRRIVAEDAENVDGYTPSLIEHRFGGDNDSVEIGGFALRGAIDRVDVAEDGRAVVTDYKRTCAARHGAAKMLSEGLVQIPLYMEAVRQTLGFEPVAGVYRGLAAASERGAVLEGALSTHALVRGDQLSKQDLEVLLSEAVDLAASAVDRMRAGDIAPRPRTSTSCTGCLAGAGCGSRQ